MQGLSASVLEPTTDRSRAVLDRVHAFLAAGATASVDDFLADLVAVTNARSLALARSNADSVVVRFPRDHNLPLPSQLLPLDQFATAPAVCVGAPLGGEWLVATAEMSDPPDWLLWLECEERRAWSAAEGAALSLAAGALSRWLLTHPQTAAARRQRRLELAAEVSVRIAHDYGNVLTCVMGFADLALAEPGANAKVRAHLAEVRRAAEEAAALTNRLRLYGKPGQGKGAPTPLAEVLREEQERLRQETQDRVRISLALPDELPRVALAPNLLRALLSQLLDNARDAVASGGTITVHARTTTLSGTECLRLYGHPMPGPCLEVTIEDTGAGLTEAARQRIFVEPLFSTRLRHRGLGLSIAFGILRANRGGFRLEPAAEHGTVARVFLPLAD